MNTRFLEVFKQVTEEHKGAQSVSRDDKVMIIDGLNLYIRVFSAVPSLNDDGMHIGGVTGFLRSLALLLRTHKPTRCIICFDGKGGSAKRKKIFKEYKENRAVKTKFNRHDEFSDLQDEQASMRMQFQRLIQYLQVLPIDVIAVDDIEADDSIAYITTQVLTDSDVIIVSTDRDYLQLCNERVSVWSPIKKQLYTPDLVFNEFGVHIDNFLLYRTIIGDTGDNIPGVPRIGKKTLLKLIPEFQNPGKFDIDFIMKRCGELPKNKAAQSLAESRDLLELNYALMQLEDPDIHSSAKMLLLDFTRRPGNTYNTVAFKQLFMYDKMFTTIKDVDTWLRTSFGYLSAIK